MAATIACAEFDQRDLFRVVGTAFPSEEFTLTWQIFIVADRASRFQTYFSIGPTSFTGSSDYQVCFDGEGTVPNGGVAPSSAQAVGSSASDEYHLSTGGVAPDPTIGAWRQQAYRRRKRGANDYEQFFYLNLATDTSHISKDDTNPLTWAAGHVLMFASDPWVTTGNEGTNCKMRALKAWSNAQIEADLQAESAYSSIVTVNGASNIWGRWPLVSDANDVSGNARHLTAEGVVTFDGLDILPQGGPVAWLIA